MTRIVLLADNPVGALRTKVLGNLSTDGICTWAGGVGAAAWLRAPSLDLTHLCLITES